MGAAKQDARPRSAIRTRKRAAAVFAAFLALTPFAWALGPGQERSRAATESHYTDAHLSATPPAGSGLSTYEWESQTLGAEHAADHAAAREELRRAEQRLSAMTPEERIADAARQEARTAEINSRISSPRSRVGAWAPSPFPINEYAIHAVLLPTGKVLMWGYNGYGTDPGLPADKRPNAGTAFLWDPSKGTGPGSMKQADPPVEDHDRNPSTPAIRAPLYCSGQTLLPSGEVLTTGGNRIWPENDPSDSYTIVAGWNGAFTFNPWTERWRRQPNIRDGRWYPSQVLLGSGRTAIFSGYNSSPPGGKYNPRLEVFNPPKRRAGRGSFSYYPKGNRELSLYPHLFTLPTGDVLLAGKSRAQNLILNVGGKGKRKDDWTYKDGETLPHSSTSRTGGNAVLLPRGPSGSSRVVLIGGYSTEPPQSSKTTTATRRVEQIDALARRPDWDFKRPLRYGRSYQSTVLLPDSTLVTVGGGLGRRNNSPYATWPDGRLRQVELYNPKTNRWTLGPAQKEDRAYHSIALLLPDGRVLSAGDDFAPRKSGTPEEFGPSRFSDSDTAEIYSPAYLFRGKRPRLGRVPKAARYGAKVGIRTRSRKLTKAVLVAPSAVTHGNNMSQRLVPLKIVKKRSGRGLTVRMPSRANIAPPGYYMLFILNKKGVPSIAKWIKIR